MPIFDYSCNDCNKIWEEFKKSQDNPEFCPNCKSENIKKLISKSNFQLKGNWYKTTKSY